MKGCSWWPCFPSIPRCGITISKAHFHDSIPAPSPRRSKRWTGDTFPSENQRRAAPAHGTIETWSRLQQQPGGGFKANGSSQRYCLKADPRWTGWKYVCLAPRHSTSSKSFKRHFLFPAFREWQAERKDPRANAGNFEVGCAEGAMSRFVRVLIIMHSLKLT